MVSPDPNPVRSPGPDPIRKKYNMQQIIHVIPFQVMISYDDTQKGTGTESSLPFLLPTITFA